MPRRPNEEYQGSMTEKIMEGVKQAFFSTSVLDKEWVAYEFFRDPAGCDFREAARRVRCKSYELILTALWFTECPLFILNGQFTASVPKLVALVICLKIEGQMMTDIAVLQLFEKLMGQPLECREYLALAYKWAANLEKQVVHTLKNPVKTCVQPNVVHSSRRVVPNVVHSSR